MNELIFQSEETKEYIFAYEVHFRFSSECYLSHERRNKGDMVIVHCERGYNIGFINRELSYHEFYNLCNRYPKAKKILAGLSLEDKKIRDMLVTKINAENHALEECRTHCQGRRIGALADIVGAEFQFDRKKLTIFVKLYENVSVCRLVRKLYDTFKMRVKVLEVNSVEAVERLTKKYLELSKLNISESIIFSPPPPRTSLPTNSSDNEDLENDKQQQPQEEKEKISELDNNNNNNNNKQDEKEKPDVFLNNQIKNLLNKQKQPFQQSSSSSSSSSQRTITHLTNNTNTNGNNQKRTKQPNYIHNHQYLQESNQYQSTYLQQYHQHHHQQQQLNNNNHHNHRYHQQHQQQVSQIQLQTDYNDSRYSKNQSNLTGYYNHNQYQQNRSYLNQSQSQLQPSINRRHYQQYDISTSSTSYNYNSSNNNYSSRSQYHPQQLQQQQQHDYGYISTSPSLPITSPSSTSSLHYNSTNSPISLSNNSSPSHYSSSISDLDSIYDDMTLHSLPQVSTLSDNYLSESNFHNQDEFSFLNNKSRQPQQHIYQPKIIQQQQHIYHHEMNLKVPLPKRYVDNEYDTIDTIQSSSIFSNREHNLFDDLPIYSTNDKDDNDSIESLVASLTLPNDNYTNTSISTTPTLSSSSSPIPSFYDNYLPSLLPIESLSGIVMPSRLNPNINNVSKNDSIHTPSFIFQSI